MRLPLWTLLLALVPLACGGPTVGEIASLEVSLSLSGVGETEDVEVSRLYLSAASLSLIPCRENIEPLALPAREYDLLVEPAPRELVRTAVTELCALELEVEAAGESKLDGIPEGAALWVEGTDAAGEPFAVASTRATTLRLESSDEGGFGVVPSLLGLDLGELLSSVPLGGSEEEVDLALSERLAPAAALYADENGDRRLGKDEGTPIALPVP